MDCFLERDSNPISTINKWVSSINFVAKKRLFLELIICLTMQIT